MTLQIRNIAIIAHVDHGKTTMVDQLLTPNLATFCRNNEKSRWTTVMDNKRD